GIQAPSWCARRIQPQVYVWTDGFAWRIVRYASESRARDLSQFFPAGDAVAVHRNPSGNLKGFSGFSSRDGNCDRKLSVLDIRHEFVSCDLRSFAPLGGNLPNAEQVTSPNRNRIKPHPFGTSFARRRSAMAHESSSPRSSNEIAMSLTCKCFISIESKITPRPPGCDLVGIIIAALWYKIRLNDKLKGKLFPYVEKWEANGEFIHAAYTLRKDDDDWGQAGTLVRKVMDDAARSRLVSNVVGH